MLRPWVGEAWQWLGARSWWRAETMALRGAVAVLVAPETAALLRAAPVLKAAVVHPEGAGTPAAALRAVLPKAGAAAS